MADEAGAGSEPRWVFQMGPGGPRIGKVIDESNGGVTVAFDDERFTWEGLPRSARLVSERSIPYRALRDRHDLLEQLRVQPVDVAVQVLQDEARPLASAEILRRLVDLNLLPAEETRSWWRGVQSGLKSHSHVEVGRGRNVTYSYRAEPLEKSTRLPAAEILDRLSTTSRGGTSHDALIEQLNRVNQEGQLDATMRAWATALGLEGYPGAIDWRSLEVTRLRKRGLERLLPLAVEAREFTIAIRIALLPKQPQVTRRAARLLADQTNKQQAQAALADEIRGWAEAVEGLRGSELGEYIESTARKLTPLDMLLPAAPGAEVLAALLYLFVVIASADSDRDETDRCELWLLQRLNGANITLQRLGEALRLALSDLVSGRALLKAISSLPFRTDGFRLRALRGLAHIGHDDLLASTDAWEGAGALELARATADEKLASLLLAEPLRRRVLLQSIDDALRDYERGDLLALLEAPPRFVELIPRERFLETARRAAHGTDPADLLLQSLLGGRAVVEELEEQLQEQRRQYQELERQLGVARQEADRLGTRLRTAGRGGRSSRSSELRQARLDVMRALAQTIEEMRRGLSASALPDDEKETLMRRSLAIASNVGIRRLEEPGQVVTYHSDRHRLLEEEQRPPGEVLIIEPSYGIDEEGEVTTLLYGLVRSSGS